MGWFRARIGRIVLLALGAIALLAVGLLAAGCGGEEGQKAAKEGQKAAKEGKKAAKEGQAALVASDSGFEIDPDANLEVDGLGRRRLDWANVDEVAQGRTSPPAPGTTPSARAPRRTRPFRLLSTAASRTTRATCATSAPIWRPRLPATAC